MEEQPGKVCLSIIGPTPKAQVKNHIFATGNQYLLNHMENLSTCLLEKVALFFLLLCKEPAEFLSLFGGVSQALASNQFTVPMFLLGRHPCLHSRRTLLGWWC